VVGSTGARDVAKVSFARDMVMIDPIIKYELAINEEILLRNGIESRNAADLMTISFETQLSNVLIASSSSG
jgi:hypothetical protein